MKSYAVVTFALGKNYQNYALALANSFLLYNKEEATKFYIITNTPIDKKIHDKINVIECKDLLIGDDILLNKVFVNKYIQEENILLVDADSLICKPVQPLFYALRNEPIGVWGFTKYNYDHWKGDLSNIIKAHKIDQLKGINGCLYFFKNNSQTSEFFNLCQKLYNEYDLRALPRVYGNFKDDEIVVSLACSLLNIPVQSPNSQIKAEKMYYARKHINLFLGKCELSYSNFEFSQNNIFLEHTANPIIFCLDRATTNQLDYRFTAFLLNYYFKLNHFNRTLMAISYTIFINLYYWIKYSKWNFYNLTKYN